MKTAKYPLMCGVSPSSLVSKCVVMVRRYFCSSIAHPVLSDRAPRRVGVQRPPPPARLEKDVAAKSLGFVAVYPHAVHVPGVWTRQPRRHSPPLPVSFFCFPLMSSVSGIPDSFPPPAAAVCGPPRWAPWISKFPCWCAAPRWSLTSARMSPPASAFENAPGAMLEYLTIPDSVQRIEGRIGRQDGSLGNV